MTSPSNNITNNANGNAIGNANANANANANGNCNTNAITNGNANTNGSSPLSSAHEDSAASISIARRHLPTRKNVAKKKRNLRESLPPLPPADVWHPHDIPTAEEAIASIVRRSERNKGKPLRNYDDMESESDYQHPSSSSNQKSKSTSGSKTKSVKKASVKKAKHKQPKSSSGSKANPVKKSKRNQHNVPQDVIADIQLNALDNTRVAENNLPETKLVIPRHTDVKLADNKQKNKRDGAMVLHEKRFGYSIIPNDENYARNRCLEQITRYENQRDYSAFDEYETGVIQKQEYSSTGFYLCFGVRGHFSVFEVEKDDGSLDYEIECNACSELVDTKTIKLAKHAAVCYKAELEDREQDLEYLSMLEFRLSINPDEQSRVGMINKKGRALNGIKIHPLRSLESKSKMSHDELTRICGEMGVSIAEKPFLLGLLDPTITSQQYNITQRYLNSVRKVSHVVYKGLEQLGYPMGKVQLKRPNINWDAVAMIEACNANDHDEMNVVDDFEKKDVGAEIDDYAEKDVSAEIDVGAEIDDYVEEDVGAEVDVGAEIDDYAEEDVGAEVDYKEKYVGFGHDIQLFDATNEQGLEDDIEILYTNPIFSQFSHISTPGDAPRSDGGDPPSDSDLNWYHKMAYDDSPQK
jgi:hypothetical protein